MRHFFRRRMPPFNRILLVESGSREISEKLLPIMRRTHGEQVRLDVVTCFPGLPAGYPPGTRVFHTKDYPDRRQLLAELKAGRYDILAIICSGQPILFKSKWALAAGLPVKVLIVNENVDYFPLDYAHWKTLLRLSLDRAGLAGPSAAKNLATLALFPFALAYLLFFAAFVHTRRLLFLPGRDR